MKMYKINDLIELLRESNKYSNNFAGFEINEAGNLCITLKEHAPGWRDKEGFGEAVEELELLENEGEY